MSTMFDRAFQSLPEKPSEIAKEVYRERQKRLLSQLDIDDLVIISSLPEATEAMMFTIHIDLQAICSISVAGLILMRH